MAKFEIVNDSKSPPKQNIVRVKFELCDGNSTGDHIVARAVDDRGSAIAGGHLFTLSSRGISLTVCVSPSIGLPLDELGRIVLASY